MIEKQTFHGPSFMRIRTRRGKATFRTGKGGFDCDERFHVILTLGFDCEERFHVMPTLEFVFPLRLWVAL